MPCRSHWFNNLVSRRALALFLALGVIWGVPYLLIKYAIVSFTPVTLVFLRTALGGLVLLPLALRQRAFVPLRSRWKPLLGYTVAEIAVPWLALSDAERVVSSGLAALLIAGVPVVGLVLAFLTGRAERLGPLAAAGLILGMSGVGLLVGREAMTGPGSTVALLEMAPVVVGYALGPMIIARWLHDIPSSGVIVASLLIVAAGCAPWGVAQWPSRIEASALTAVVLLGLLCTALAFLFLFALVAEVGPVRATVITYINPAVAVAAGVIFLAEPLTATTVLGFAAIAAGSYLVQRRPRGTSQPVAAP